jgi:hypothetical protein
MLRQLEVFDDITALIDSQPVVSFWQIRIYLLDVIEGLRFAMQLSLAAGFCACVHTCSLDRLKLAVVSSEEICGGV